MPPPPPKKPVEPPKDYWFEFMILILFIGVFGVALLVLVYTQLSGLKEVVLDILDQFVKPVFLVLDAVILVGFIYVFYEGSKLRPLYSIFEEPIPGEKPKGGKDPEIAKRWAHILERAAKGDHGDLRLAMIEADALVDACLKQAGYQGEHMSDRLSQIDPQEIGSLQMLWRAHKLRNDIVHTPGFIISTDEARIALKSFEVFMTDLGAL